MVSLIETQDGSHSLLSERFGVSYHSKYGAIQESQHVFLEAGLAPLLPGRTDTIRVFEMGFGTGLNALLTSLAAQKAEKHIYYEAVEAFPVDLDQVHQLNYPDKLQTELAALQSMHSFKKEEVSTISPYFDLLVWWQPLMEAPLTGNFDVVYYDAFAPSTQPELWERATFQKIYDAMRVGGVLVTYCAKGVVKRTLRDIGFTVEGIPGPPGKREMTRAYKN